MITPQQQAAWQQFTQKTGYTPPKPIDGPATAYDSIDKKFNEAKTAKEQQDKNPTGIGIGGKPNLSQPLETARAVGDFVTGSEQATAKDFGATKTTFSTQDAQRMSDNAKQLIDHAKTVTDPTRRQQLLKIAQDITNTASGQAQEQSQNIPSTGQAALDVGGVAADVLGSGTFGKATEAMKTGELAVKAPTIVTATQKAADTIGQGAGKVTQATTQIAKDLSGGVKEAGNNIFTPIPENVKNMLKSSVKPAEMESNLTKYFDIAREAKGTTGVSTPLDVAGKEQLGGALKQIKTELTKAGQLKEGVLKVFGKKPVVVQDAYNTLGNALRDRLGTGFDGAGNLVSTEGRQSLVIGNKADEKVVNLAHQAIEDLRKTPTLQKVNDVVDRLQNELFKSRQIGAEPITNQTKAVIDEFAHNLNESAKEAGGNVYKKANEEYSRLRPIHDELSQRLGNNMKNAGSVMKRIFSPQDGGIKNLVTKVEQETGRKIFDHATLSKFAMDSVGDSRAKSLLDKVPEGKGVTMKIINGIMDKLQNPEAVAKNILKSKQ